MTKHLVAAVCVIAAAVASPSAQSDLDALMQRVLARRDDNWKKLQQYVLEERATIEVTAPDGRRLYGSKREFLWFPRDGRFIKSPLTADGVTIGEEQRRRAERLWVAREEARATGRVESSREAANGRSSISIGPGGLDVQLQSAIGDAMEPGFVSAAYFLDFKFEPGQYALVGREQYEGRDVLRIEYYPTLLFKEGRTRPNKELRKRDDRVEEKMNKVSLVTLWVDAAQNQIVKYDFRNIDTDFLPARWFTRLEELSAAMEMAQPFPNVWLPRLIRIGFNISVATGEYRGTSLSEFHDYRLATVDTRLRP